MTKANVIKSKWQNSKSKKSQEWMWQTVNATKVNVTEVSVTDYGYIINVNEKMVKWQRSMWHTKLMNCLRLFSNCQCDKWKRTKVNVENIVNVTKFNATDINVTIISVKRLTWHISMGRTRSAIHVNLQMTKVSVKNSVKIKCHRN